jgi:chromate reductase, NAD(P)H dehydrogenase (quinone)
VEQIMTKPFDVVAIVGSLRAASLTRRVVLALAAMMHGVLSIEILDIGGLALYNQDMDTDPPAAWSGFRARVKRADAVLFATPEYNRSVPGALKNAIDVGSRPYGSSAWAGKPAAVLSVSPGAMGAFGANHHLRQSLVFLDMPTLQQPEAYFGGADKLLDPEGRIINADTRDFMLRFGKAFESWVERQTIDPCQRREE